MTTFTVFGPPATKGSTVSFMGHNGRIVTKTDSTGLPAWTQAVGWAARAAGVPLATRNTPVHVRADFMFAKPTSVRRLAMTVRPDIDKVTRALLDGLTGIAYEDDAQVTQLVVAKRYGDSSCVTVIVMEG